MFLIVLVFHSSFKWKWSATVSDWFYSISVPRPFDGGSTRFVLDFYELLPEIERTIDECQFIAIDGEFTGLHNGTMVSEYDTAAQYYQKVKGQCMDFLMIQFGLCAVKYDAKKKKYDSTIEIIPWNGIL